MHLPDYFYFVFAICLVVSFCVVLFYAKRHPIPHFRPKKSDIGLVSFLLLFVSGGVAFITAGAFDADYDKEKLEKKMKEAQNKIQSGDDGSGGDGSGGGAGAPTGGSSGGNSNIPDDVPDEVREAFDG